MERTGVRGVCDSQRLSSGKDDPCQMWIILAWNSSEGTAHVKIVNFGMERLQGGGLGQSWELWHVKGLLGRAMQEGSSSCQGFLLGGA